ncbi:MULTISPECIES: fimbrial protein [unclassified Serratia (in: enterobacteria)]|uniref:fimbrial protein n=1 Tax=unclassified Serratia (in: enterobacteria) TaxID=2647522 RepID=UPI003076246F
MKVYNLLLKKTMVCIAIMGLWSSYSALAADIGSAQLNITGTVKASPCTVDSTDGQNVNVNLGTDIQATSLSTGGQGSTLIPFTLHLKDCPTSTSSVTATFSGVQADEDATLYKNTGDATRVQIELQDTAGNKKGNGSTMTANVVSATSDASFLLRARAYTVNGGVTPGSIVGTVQVAFTYQ